MKPTSRKVARHRGTSTLHGREVAQCSVATLELFGVVTTARTERFRSMTGLTSGSSVAEARIGLQALAADDTLTDAEREYFSELLGAVDDRGDSERIGDSLNGVPCRLE
jgi:hypothetical protein